MILFLIVLALRIYVLWELFNQVIKKRDKKRNERERRLSDVDGRERKRKEKKMV